MSKIKTNAMRILDNHNIEYDIITYNNTDGKIDGISVAQKIGKDPKEVFKTLVAQGSSRDIYVFIIPVAEELDLKKAGKVTGEKKVEMVHVKDITKYTGYIRGGCSPIGMKKKLMTYIQEDVQQQDKVAVSAGKRGLQVILAPLDLVKVTHAICVDVIRSTDE